ncbi:DUF2243 domain-containing protein [Siccirubricoccus sp. KC 17139]|uniref:DUF2243 domain-containing protein n=1 Tax=Siccirubricoccus soli TaxID=2899147 RepID=A0ABT1D4R2_9PROT|nr:DUF2243 domain-containing protein [Siccirubricoccus soli]MCO6416916.1 DUF2243 domain-containing protein [Siccirubricoccus soli]MCP2683051.1 DUF2243 domain-containing protein [Siccirubricoccus soli]
MRMGWAGALMGFAFGGFLDGILLHQILQWHHLLSGWRPGGTIGLLRWHVQWDGVFHAAHYLVLAFGLALLWPRPGHGRVFGAGFAIGFGAWHVLDAVVNHWALGLHRIRQDAAQPLWWDLVFFGLGLAAIALGLLWRRRGPALRPEGFAVLVLAAGLGAARPAPGPALLAFALPDEAALHLAASSGAALVAAQDGLWVFATPDPAGLVRLAGTRPLPALPGGCLSRI